MNPKPLIPGELLGYQTATFLAAAGIPPDRKANHSSEEWKLFMAGFDLAARLAERMPAFPAAVQPADERKPYAWTRKAVICNEQGYAIGMDEPEFRVGAESPGDDIDGNWSPLFFDAPASAPAPESQPAAVDILSAALKDCATHPRLAQRENIVRKAMAKVAALAAPVPAAQEGAQPKQPIIGRLLDQLMAAEFLWGLNEPGALMRERDVTRIVLAVGKEYGLLTAPAMEAKSHEGDAK